MNYMQLGATLFIPASHKRLEAIVCQNKYPHLKSVVIDFEDGLDDNDFEYAIQSINSILKNITKEPLLTFIRAKDVQHLSELLQLSNINNITGFVLAKFSLVNAEEYLSLLINTNHLIMPSIEGRELFNHQELNRLKEVIITNKQKVLLVRFGLEDMLRQLSLRRGCDESIFDLSAPASVIGNFIATFKSADFGVSGGVYPCFKDTEGFIKDVKRDIKEGLISKTIIHPKQIELFNECYKVTQEEYEEAKEIVDSQRKVFAQGGKMAESITMHNYSQELLLRADVFGIIKD